MGDWFSFDGRISRQDYWLRYVLLIGIIQIAVMLISAIANGPAPGHPGLLYPLAHPHGILVPIAALVLLVPSLAGAVKRLHDRDRSGWFYFIVFVPLIGGIWLMVELGFLRGTPGMNRFGPDLLPPRRL